MTSPPQVRESTSSLIVSHRFGNGYFSPSTEVQIVALKGSPLDGYGQHGFLHHISLLVPRPHSLCERLPCFVFHVDRVATLNIGLCSIPTVNGFGPTIPSLGFFKLFLDNNAMSLRRSSALELERPGLQGLQTPPLPFSIPTGCRLKPSSQPQAYPCHKHVGTHACHPFSPDIHAPLMSVYKEVPDSQVSST